MQVIQTVSAVDKDDPIQGHYFDYRLVPEMLNNPNFTIKNNQGDQILSICPMPLQFHLQPARVSRA